MRLVASVVVTAALLLTASSAGAADLSGVFVFDSLGTGRQLSEKDLRVSVDGSVAIEYHGSASAGCAAIGVCNVSGAITWDPGSGADLSVITFLDRGKRRLSATLAFTGGNGPVTRAKVTGPTGATCTDATGGAAGSVVASGLSSTALQIRLVGPAESDAFVTHCAGPAASDLTALLPVRLLPRSVLHGGTRTLDLSTTRPFSKAGFSGTLRSTVRLRIGPNPRNDFGITPPTPADQPLLQHTLSAHYRITAIGGGLAVDVHGDPDPLFCVELDSCGSRGTLSVVPGAPSGGTFRLSAITFGRRTRAQLLTALGLRGGHRPRGVLAAGAGLWSSPQGQLRTSLARNDGGDTCSDAVPLRHGFLLAHIAGGRLEVTYYTFPGAALPVHTHCPGPLLTDLGSDGELATGSVPISALRHRTITIHLNGGSSSRAVSGYSLSSRPDLTVTLQRTGIRERRFRL